MTIVTVKNSAGTPQDIALFVPGTAGAGVSPDVMSIQGISGGVAIGVSGTFWQATQPVSIAGTVAISASALPLPAGAATSAKQPALGTAGTASSDVLTVQGIASMTPLLVNGSGVTQPVSLASQPLPTGASTAAKQPALGTAGTPSADVLTIQGVTSMTALKVDGSAVTQPVSISGTIPISAAALPLPTGAATSAKQPALGTAGTAATDVLTIQGIASMTALKVDGSAVTQPVAFTPATTGGLVIYRTLSLVATGVNVKNSAGQLFGYHIINNATTTRYVKLYNTATAPTAGSGTPLMTLGIPAGTVVIFNQDNGIAFSSGIGIVGTQLVADTDTTAPLANELVVNLFYK